MPSITEWRVRSIVRNCKPPLDAVIERAKEEAAAQVAQDEALRLKNKFKGVGSVAGMAAVARRAARITGPDAAVDHSVDAEDARPSGGGGSSKAHSTPVRKRRYNVEEHQRKALPSSSSVANRKAQAQVIGDERSITFGASASLFYGRQGQQGRRKYPHELDQSVIVAAISNPVRHSRVSEELRAARLRKYDDDVDRMAYAERLHRTTLLPQADGELLRFGRLDAAWDGRLQYSAPMHKRGQIATWNYRKGFFVLCEGLLHEFGDSSLTSPLLAAWPVLGCSMRKCAASHKLFPYAFELTINSYFVSDSILASTEFACDSPEAVKKVCGAPFHRDASLHCCATALSPRPCAGLARPPATAAWPHPAMPPPLTLAFSTSTHSGWTRSSAPPSPSPSSSRTRTTARCTPRRPRAPSKSTRRR